MKRKKESFFWTSYSDLMTSLFFVMLVLFVLTVGLLHNKMIESEAARIATEKQLENITRLNKSIENIDSGYFEYNDEYKRHTLKNITVSFRKGSSNIFDIPGNELQKLRDAGRSIQSFMNNAKSIPGADYLLIVEGQSSKDFFSRNDELSYSRALSLVKYWQMCGIDFENLPCEVIVSGSGQSSKFRVSPDIASNAANQRFVIHIIPKPGKI